VHPLTWLNQGKTPREGNGRIFKKEVRRVRKKGAGRQEYKKIWKVK
jgi:hypothetical protein